MASFYVRVTTSVIRWGVIVLLCFAIVLVVISFQQKNNLQTRVKLVKTFLHQQQSQSSSSSSQYGPPIELPDRDELIFDWEGYFYNKNGIYKDIIAEVQTSFIHSFSPDIENHVAKKFVDPAKQNVFFANSPAIRWHNGSLVLVCRIWLDKERYLDKDNFPLNDFQDNYLYTQTFDTKLNPTSPGRILSILVTKKSQLGDGPIEPRIHSVNNKLYTTFNAAIMFPWGQKIDWTLIYDNEEDVTYIPEMKGGSPAVYETVSGVPRDKHWMALVQNDELHFVHNLDPLSVMKCSVEGKCDFIYKTKFPQDFVFSRNQYIGHLRGGTPFEHYSGNYYVSIAHGTLVTMFTRHRLYSCHLVVLYAQAPSSYRVVYASDSIQFNSVIYKRIPQVRQGIGAGFLFPVSLLIETADSWVIGGHVNDHSAVLVRLQGVEALMEAIIEQDQLQEEHLRQGPPPGIIRRHLRDMVQNRTGVKLLV